MSAMEPSYVRHYNLNNDLTSKYKYDGDKDFIT